MDPQQNANMNNVPPATQPSGSSSGPVIGIIIILIIIILGGLYFWGQRDVENVEELDNASTESITTQSDSDETDSIENDLNNTDVEVDAAINAS